MRKGSFYILWIAAGLLACGSFLLLTQEAGAIKFPMPDIKGQFKKQDLHTTSQVTLQADQVSFSSADNKAHARGNVVVNSKDQQLFCDQLQLDRTVQEVVAEGDVYLDTPKENVIAQGLTYNFDDGTGEFRDARVYLDPYLIKGQKINKISDDYMTMDEGYMTSCDLDEPHYRMGAHRMDIYQHDKAIIHGMKIYLGKVPVMYLPYYVQNLKNRPIITFVPGDKKDFGLFLLTTARFQAGEHMKVTLHLDTRERDGFGEGFDVHYNTPNFGSGLVSAYYTDENQIASHHLWDLYNSQGVKVGPTMHHERYRIIWRHQWRIDKNTDAVFQYYKIHDYDILNNGFLKTYFPRDYQQNAQNSNYDTYFILTHSMPHGTLTFDVDTSRENRPLRGIERIPEVKYVLNNQQIGKTGFYAKSANTFSDLSYQNYPKTVNEKTMRFDSNNDISHPFKIGFISFNPHLGGEETYYSRTANISQSNIIRGMFRGSLDMSTKFYKVWDYHTNFAGLNINGLRHVVTPTITYLYQARPTFPASSLNQFDPSIDNLYRIHQFAFGLENKLQTKRDGQVVDLLRYLVTVNYGLKGTTGHRGFDPYDTLLDFNPTNWLTLHNDNEYDFHAGHWNAENFDGVIHVNGWSFSLGNRYTRDEGDQLTTEWDYTINPKWKFKIYNSFPLTQATQGATGARDNQYILTRDLHEWEMDLGIDRMEGQGSTFYVMFRLKLFPDMKMNFFRSTFQPSRPGSQS
ncbi:MAG: LPS-assembly protein LptD [Candidatus Omnitrophica bacterium]|nr:LPS-assembly protein LptD [Candidatus Omnitrophota bacterium]